jgi:hypothetical protein
MIDASRAAVAAGGRGPRADEAGGPTSGTTPPRGASSRSRIRTVALLFAFTVLIYNANLREISSQDTISTRILPVAMIEARTLTLDMFFRDHVDGQPLPYWVQKAGSHYVSTVPVMPAVLALPVYLIPILMFGGGSWALVSFLAKVSATLIAGLSVALVYLAAEALAPGRTALAIGLVYAIGTSTWSIASQGLWGHGPAQLFMAAALYCMVRSETDRRFLVPVGLAVGLMLATRLATWPAGVALLAYVLRRDVRRAVQAVLLCAVGFLPFAAYNLATFGSVQGGYARNFSDWAPLDGFASAWATPLGSGLSGLLLSPNRGLLVYSPILLFAFVGIPMSLMGPRRAFYGYVAAGLAGGILMLSKFSWWFGGACFGPRLLTDYMPALVLFLVPAWQWMERAASLKVVACWLFAASVFVQFIGAFYYPSPRGVDWDAVPRDVPIVDRVWDWKDTQLLRLLRNGPRPVGFGPFE